MKELQQHYTKELSDALEKLEQNYHSKRNEAFEKLVYSEYRRVTSLISQNLFFQEGKQALIQIPIIFS